MANPTTLPMTPIVDVVVTVSPVSPAQPTFNQGLIIGSSGVIPSIGANSRIRQYTSLAEMLLDGFITTDPEYIAASLYFSQHPAAVFLWVGCQDPSGIGAANFHTGNAGTGYAVGDQVTVTQGGASGGVLQVTSIGGGGAVTGLSLVTSGTGYSVANGLATTTTGAGTGLEVDITAIGEPALQAVIACRAANFEWYGFMVTVTSDADELALAAWVQTATPSAQYFFNTSDANVLNNVTNNIMAQMKALEYSRVFGMYSTTQSGVFPNNAYASAAALGVAMGLNTGLANSYFIMMFKTLVGITPEPLTANQVNVLNGLNCNVYVNYGNSFSFAQRGTAPNGQFFDEVLNVDMLSSGIQFNVMDLLTASPAVPQTDPGETQLIHAVNQACEASRIIGFIATGVWTGAPILNLNTGASVPGGYLTQAAPYATQSAADRAARKAMPIYVALIEAGAVQSLVVGVLVQR